MPYLFDDVDGVITAVPNPPGPRVAVHGLPEDLAHRLRARVVQQFGERLKTLPRSPCTHEAAAKRAHASDWLDIEIEPSSANAASQTGVLSDLLSAAESAVGDSYLEAHRDRLRTNKATLKVKPRAPGDNVLDIQSIGWWGKDANGSRVWQRTPIGGKPVWKIALLLSGSDAGFLSLSEGAPFVGRHQCRVTFVEVQTNWAKELWSFKDGRGMGGVLHVEGHATGTVSLLADPNTADTMVFRKPGFLGVWYDVAHFAFGGEVIDFLADGGKHFGFWDAFAGTDFRFTWVFD